MNEVADRTQFIGGSDIAAILGISPWRSALGLWTDKVYPKADEDDSAKRRGKRLEPYILDMIKGEFRFEIMARNQRYTDPDVPYFSAEIDAEAPGHLAHENIEIKTVHPYKLREWGEEETDALPLHYAAQAQWGLGVTRRDICQVFALIGDDLRHYVIERDEPTITAMRERAAEFWSKFVVPKIAPPLDYEDDRVLDYLKRIYPGTDGMTLQADESDESWRRIYDDARIHSDKYENVAQGAKMHLLERMGNAAMLKFSDGRVLRRKFIEVKGYTVADRKQLDVRFVKAPK